MSFYTSISGTKGAQADIAVISNNLANAQTTGFKRSRVEFGDLFAAAPTQTAREVAGQGVRVNAVAPGMTEPPMTAAMLKLPALREGAGRQYPLGGVQSAAQVAEVMAWLLGEGAARLTGQVIAVDGGFTSVRPLVK